MTPSSSVSIQQTLTQARSVTVSPSVGRKVVDVNTIPFGLVNPTLRNKKCKDGGQVQGKSYLVAALLASSEKKRKGAVKKCLSPIIVAVAEELEYGSVEGSSEEDSPEKKQEQRSPNTEDPASEKRKSFGGFDGRETRRDTKKKKSLLFSSEPRVGTSSQNTGTSSQKAGTFSQRQELSGAGVYDEGADKASRSGKKGKTPVSERVSMAKTTRGATTTLVSEPVSLSRTTRKAATKSKGSRDRREHVGISYRFFVET